MKDQAFVLRDRMQQRQQAALQPSSPPQRTAYTLAVTSGKGGVGKTSLALNLAIAAAQLPLRVCVVDANPGLGNVDLLCGLNGYWNLSHVLSGARTLAEIVLEGPAGVSVVPGAGELWDLCDAPPSVQQEMLAQLQQLERDYDLLVIDAGTGMHKSLRRVITSADRVTIVTTPEPTAIAEAYATVKALAASDHPPLECLVNQCETHSQANQILGNLTRTARLFLHREVEPAGSVPRDESVPQAVFRRRPYLLDQPGSPAARATQQLARRLDRLLQARSAREAFFPRLLRPSLHRAA